MFWALDNREPLPPFLPAFRAEDTLFGFFLQRTRDDFYYAHLPFSLLHAPGEGRTYDAGSAARVRVSDIIAMCCSTCQNAPGDVSSERLREIGLHLCAIGGLSPKAFQDYLHQLLWTRASHLAAAQDAALTQHSDAPAYWLEGMRLQAATLRAAVQQPEYLVPADLNGFTNVDAALLEIRTILSRFGRLLVSWPTIAEATRYLAARGFRLAQPV